ncbi:MAG: hypothetical protein QME94_17990 [Anaerolineae bacterium]|nr:hypothetical protein [Anaerolineae bacterium]
MVNLTLVDTKLHVAASSEAAPTTSLRLDSLRIVVLFTPDTCDWHFVEASSGRSLANLERLSPDELSELCGKAADLGPEAGEFSLLLQDYAGHSACIPVADICESGLDLFGELTRYRDSRRARLAEWTRCPPTLIVVGAQGDGAALGQRGVRPTGGELMPWADLERVEVEPAPAQGLDGYRFVPRAGSGRSEFSVRMPSRKAELFVAEVAFWRSLGLEQRSDAA